MASQIDATKPVEGNATTASVRQNFAVAASEISTLQLLTGVIQDDMLPDAPADGFPYSRFSQSWMRLAAFYPQMFGAVPGGPDATAALQAGLDAAYNFGLDFIIAGGVYSTTGGLKTYGGVTVRFTAGGSLKMTQAGACIATRPSPGAPAAVTRGVTIEKPIIDMNNLAGAAIVLESSLFGKVTQPRILNLAPQGVFPWYDPHDHNGSLPNAGIIVKGVTPGGDSGAANPGFGSYYNTIENVAIEVANGGYGIWLGTSLTGTTARGNFNQIYGGLIRGCAVGVYIKIGGDNTIESLDVSQNTTGMVLGTEGELVSRTHIVKLYCENCQVGVHIGAHANRTMFWGSGSWSDTAQPIVEDVPASGVSTTYFVNVDTAGSTALVDWGEPFPGAMFNILSGTGNAYQGAIGLVAYKNPANLALARYDGSPSAKAANAFQAALGQIFGLGYDGVSLSAPGNSPDITFLTAEAWSAAGHGANVQIHVIAPGSLSKVLGLSVRATSATFVAGAGFYGTTPPTTQPDAGGSAHLVNPGSGTQVFANTTFDGNSGTTGYTIGDLVRVMKQYGMIAS
jgi:hypothetical protein